MFYAINGIEFWDVIEIFFLDFNGNYRSNPFFKKILLIAHLENNAYYYI